MASHPVVDPADDNGEPPRTDFADHQRTFDALIGLTKWGIAIVALILVGMWIFLL